MRKLVLLLCLALITVSVTATLNADVHVSAIPSVIPADGQSSSSIEAFVVIAGTHPIPVPGVDVYFSVGGSGILETTAPVTTDSYGVARNTLYSTTNPDTVPVYANTQWYGNGYTIVITTIVSPPNQEPTVTASVDPDVVKIGESAQFSADASDPDGTIVSYWWNFGDGETSEEQNPTHAYASTGTFVAYVTVTDDDDAQASDSVSIEVEAPVNQEPTVTASADPSSVQTLESVQFSADASDPDGTIVAYFWMLGDGTSTYVQNPVHSYADDGEYSAIVFAYDNDGAVATDTVLVSVANRAPSVTASASPNPVKKRRRVYFSASASDMDGTVVSYYWDFGDGKSSTAQNPIHRYGNRGDFTATVTVTDNDGAESSDSIVITVY